MASKKRKCKDLVSDCEFENMFALLFMLKYVFQKLLYYILCIVNE